ncbi:MAG: metallophosphoesterase [Gammaproteobacteria bacterium]|nr:metallophosphoesterase [Gammaproteobacteria bacterium]MCZ6488434.1 metallophosphoesterase [Gammaproteobacteria bacterium]MCZ6668622.1 metallophosphoesterase [Gammaproteobacteria bacterium]MCZ6724529.1 metallophosphoesterase [Gammaproteobacteria bacterium]
MKILRVAQITDIHLLAENGSMLHGVDTAVTLGEVTCAIKKLFPVPDLIIVTGDLADDGSRETYKRLRKILSATNLPVYVLAGNHDDIGEMHESLVGGNIHFKSMLILNGWAFMFINSKVDGESFGLIDPHEQSQLENNLNSVDNLPVLLALHHSPIEICSSADCQLKNASDFTHLLERFPGIKGVIGGHTHTAAEKRNPGHIQYISPSSFAQILHDQPEDLSADGGFWSSHRLKRASHGFRVLDLRPDGRISSEVHWPGAD